MGDRMRRSGLNLAHSCRSVKGIGVVHNTQFANPFHSYCRVVKGMDVVLMLEKVKVDKNDKPFDDIKISSISVLDQAPV